MWLVALIALILGLHTSSWQKVSGAIVTQGSFGTLYGGYTTRHAAKGGYLRFDKAEYSYWHEDRYYFGRLICICIPLGVLTKAPDGRTIPVYVLRHAPGFSVLRTGPDYIGIVLLILIGAAPYYLAYVLDKLARATNA
jgi:hypothetical protein